MALNTMRFAFKAEPGLSDSIQKLKDIEKIILNCIVGRDYGVGVKAIYVGIVMMEAAHATRFANKKPAYKAGKYELRQAGVSIWLEDTLEFDIILQIEDVRRAVSTAELAEILRKAFEASYLSLQRTKIPNFDMMRTLRDLDEILKRIASARSSNDLSIQTLEALGNVTAEYVDKLSVSSSVKSFAQDVLAFVERELPNVKLAVQERRRELLKPVIARSQELLERWRLTSPVVLESCPPCACLIADVVREAAIELDDLSFDERRRIHEEFQRELDLCKMIAM
jgi:hypothetical protein